MLWNRESLEFMIESCQRVVYTVISNICRETKIKCCKKASLFIFLTNLWISWIKKMFLSDLSLTCMYFWHVKCLQWIWVQKSISLFLSHSNHFNDVMVYSAQIKFWPPCGFQACFDGFLTSAVFKPQNCCIKIKVGVKSQLGFLSTFKLRGNP